MKYLVIMALLVSANAFAVEVADVYVVQKPQPTTWGTLYMATESGKKITLYCPRKDMSYIQIGNEKQIDVPPIVCTEVSERKAGTRIEFEFTSDELKSVRFLNP